jgi:serine/threonine protein kinase
METQDRQHPSALHLAALALGKLKPDAAAKAQSHLDECGDCRGYVSDTPRDELAEIIRQARGKSAADQNTPASGLSGTVVGLPDPPLLPTLNTAAPLAPPNSSPQSTPSPVAHAVSESEIPRDLFAQSKYRIVRVLGRGGMGTVYEAELVRMQRPVAIKVINPELVNHPQAVLRFEEEIKAVASLDHANIARAFDAENIGSLQVFVMEFVRGQTLYDFLQSRGQLSVTDACRCVRQALIGLQHAHEQGLVHRDLKPQNLMLTRDTGQIKILDFGLAKAVSENRQSHGLTGSRATMGTYAYMAPEQALDAANADIRADIYSLGCTLYLLLSGVLPFEYETDAKLLLAHQTETPCSLHELCPDVPEALSDLVARMLAKNPADRPQTPLEAADALLPFARGKAARSSGMGVDLLAGSAAKGRRINKHMWGGIAAAAIALFGFGGWEAGLFSVRTPNGTIIVENAPADADVSIDDQTVTVTRNGDSVVIAAVERGPHHLKLTRGGREVWSNDVTIEVAGQSVSVRFEPKELAAHAPTPKSPPARDGLQTADMPKQSPLANRGVGCKLALESEALNAVVLVEREGHLVDRLSSQEKPNIDLAPGVYSLSLEGDPEGIGIDQPVGEFRLSAGQVQPIVVRRGAKFAELRSPWALPSEHSKVVEFRETHGVDVSTLESWVANLPAKFLPVTITAQAGSATPRLSAISLNDNQEHTYQFVTSQTIEGTDGEKYKELSAKKLMPSVYCTFTDGGKRLQEQVWLPAKRSWLSWDGSLTGISSHIQDGHDHGMRPLQVSGCVVGDSRRFKCIMGPDKKLPWQAYMEVSADELYKLAKSTRDIEWRPDAISSYYYKGEFKFIVITIENKEKEEWSFQKDLSPEDYEASLDRHQRRGLRPLSIAAYGNSETTRYAVVWLRYRPEGSGPPRRVESTAAAASASAHTNQTSSQPEAGQPIDLLAQVQLPENVVRGEWKKTDNGIESGKLNCILKLPYKPKGEYDFRVTFTCQSGRPIVDLLLSFGATRFKWHMYGHGCGFALVDNNRAVNQNQNPTHYTTGLNTGQRYTVVIKVRSGSISAWIDDKEVSKLDTDYSNLSLDKGSDWISDESLGIWTTKSPTIFHSIEVVPVITPPK